MVRMLDLWSTGRGFESWLPHCQVQPWTSCLCTCASVTKQYKLVPAAGKVTIGLVSHCPRVTDVNGSPPRGSRPRRWTHICWLVEYGELYLLQRGEDWVDVSTALLSWWCMSHAQGQFNAIFVTIKVHFWLWDPGTSQTIVWARHNCDH